MQEIHGIVRIMGHLQGWDKPNGFHSRRKEDFENYRDREDVIVFECIRWLQDMEEYVDKLLAYGVTHLHIFGHSFGFGRGAVALVEEIERRKKEMLDHWQRQSKDLKRARKRQGQTFKAIPKPQFPIKVVSATGNDGVFRGVHRPGESIFHKIASFRSIIPGWRIPFPANSIEHLQGLRQSNRRPKGHNYRVGREKVDVEVVNIDLDGFKLVHHDARPERKERDFDESAVSRAQELEVMKAYIPPAP